MVVCPIPSFSKDGGGRMGERGRRREAAGGTGEGSRKIVAEDSPLAE
jgi:hypothetical protein